jgi:hypothetical protein
VVAADDLLDSLGYDIYGVRPVFGTEEPENGTILAQGWIRRARDTNGHYEHMVGRFSPPILLRLAPGHADWNWAMESTKNPVDQ